MNIKICKICGRECNGFRGLAAHTRRSHNISKKEYYNKYLKQDREGICYCRKETNFKELSTGYAKYCSTKCMTNSKEIQEQKKHTCLNKYGSENPMQCKKIQEKTKQTNLERYGVENPYQAKEIIKKIKQTQLKNNTLASINGKPIFNYYAPKIDWVEEVRKDPTDERFLNIRCKNCNEWFIPDIINLKSRVQALKGNYSSECNLYCSDSCKQTCSIYYKHNYQEGHPIHDMKIRDPYWTQLVKENANYECERCGSKENLIAHHELPVKTHPFFANDINNGICVCNKCDKEYFHQIDGCKTGQLARMVC